MKSAWLHLDHLLYRQLEARQRLSGKYLICVSGGIDSVVLLRMFLRVLPAPKKQICIFHFHHGPSSSEQEKYRERALQFVQSLASQNKINFIYKRSTQILTSEAELREARRQALNQLKQELDFFKVQEASQSPLIVLGHHAQDLLETRLLRLLRGTGARGLQGMRLLHDDVYRPLLEVQKSEIAEYAKKQGLTFCEDPSNEFLKFRRNWLRHVWLTRLEKDYPGASARLAQSLEIIAKELEESGLRSWNDKKNQSSVGPGKFLFDEGAGLLRSHWLALTESERSQVLARWLLDSGVFNFRSAQIYEITKQLDKAQNDLTLKFKTFTIRANAERIWLEK